MAFLNWMQANYMNLLLAISGLVAVAEVITRFTPTKVDDSILERIGKVIKGIMDFLKVPNISRK